MFYFLADFLKVCVNLILFTMTECNALVLYWFEKDLANLMLFTLCRAFIHVS
jgi:hypothetical protein